MTPPQDETGEGAGGVDIRRLLLLIAVIVGGLVYFLWDDVRDVLKPPKVIAPTMPSDVLLAANEVKIEKCGALDVTFTKIGAAITRLTWTGPDGHAEPIITQDRVPNRALLVELPGRERWSDHEFQLARRTETAEAVELAFAQEQPDKMRVLKTFRVEKARPVITVEVELSGVPPTDWVTQKGYGLWLSRAVGSPPALGKDDGLVTVRFNGMTDHHRVRRISGEEPWPTEDERRRAGHGHVEVPPTLEWAATATRYFGLIVTPIKPLDGAELMKPLEGAELTLVRTARAAAGVNLHVPPGNILCRFQVYAGPKDYDALASLGGRQEEAVNYWYFGRVATLLLRWVHDRVCRNYGVAIILVTVLFRLLMWPVTRYNLRSLVDIRVANARLAEIDAREPPRTEREARAAWLKEARVWEDVQRKATIGVFLPMLILLPALLVLYYALDVGYEFHRQGFALWITDISRRDPVFILPVLMGLAMMGQMRTMADDPKKDRTWIWMPAAFTVLFAFFSAGLVIFWLTDTLVGWFQLALIQRGRRAAAAAGQS